MAPIYKLPNERLDYSFRWVLDVGDAIVSSSWQVTPAGLTLSGQSFAASGAGDDAWFTVVWLSGGTDGTNYTLTNTITTAQGQGRIEEQSEIVRVGKEIVPAQDILRQLLGGDAFDLQYAREIVDGWVARLEAVSGGPFRDEPYARSVVRKGAKAEIWGEILRQSGRLSADETTKEEDRAEKLLKEYDAAKTLPAERSQYITTWPVARG